MLLARLLVATGLAVTGAVHLDLAASYDGLGEVLTVGQLFRAQGATALLVALWLLLRRRDRLPVLLALLVAAASTAAVVLSVHVRLPSVGPFPELYEPVWYGEKVLSAVASGVAAVVAAGALGRRRRPPAT